MKPTKREGGVRLSELERMLAEFDKAVRRFDRRMPYTNLPRTTKYDFFMAGVRFGRKNQKIIGTYSDII